MRCLILMMSLDMIAGSKVMVISSANNRLPVGVQLLFDLIAHTGKMLANKNVFMTINTCKVNLHLNYI